MINLCCCRQHAYGFSKHPGPAGGVPRDPNIVGLPIVSSGVVSSDILVFPTEGHGSNPDLKQPEQ